MPDGDPYKEIGVGQPFGVPVANEPPPPGYHYEVYGGGSNIGGYRFYTRLVADPGAASGSVPTEAPPHLQFSFDTVGQTIYRSFGHCRLPLRTIWVEGINSAGDQLPEGQTTYTFAAALCAPFDPTEDGIFAALFDGNDLLFTPDGGITPPNSWTTDEQTQLITALSGAEFYTGSEDQLPSPRIVADKGLLVANAFRNLRYVVIPGYPARRPQLSAVFQRTNAAPANVRAVHFAGDVS